MKIYLTKEENAALILKRHGDCLHVACKECPLGDLVNTDVIATNSSCFFLDGRTVGTRERVSPIRAMYKPEDLIEYLI
jgi:hypothetical protein